MNRWYGITLPTLSWLLAPVRFYDKTLWQTFLERNKYLVVLQHRSMDWKYHTTLMQYSTFLVPPFLLCIIYATNGSETRKQHRIISPLSQRAPKCDHEHRNSNGGGTRRTPPTGSPASTPQYANPTTRIPYI